MRFRAVRKMACCLNPRDNSQEAPYIIDVEKILREFVWEAFKESLPAWQRVCLRRKNFVIDVPMNYFHFDKIDQDVRRRQKPEQPPVQPQPSLAAHMRHMDQQAAKSSKYATSNVMALNTDFTNCTSKPQTYKFRFEKTRRASLRVTFQRGFTVGGKVNLTIGLPKVASDSKIGGDIDMRVNVQKTTEEVIEETLTWEATSEILVSENSRYTAKVLLSETPVSYNFMVLTRMSLLVGAAPCTVRKKNDEAFVWTKPIENLETVFEKYERERVVKINKHPIKHGDGFINTHTIDIKTTGIIEGVRLSDQRIVLEGTSLQDGRVPHTDGNSAGEDTRQRDGPVPFPASTFARLSGAPQPIIEEMPEDDGGVTETERREEEIHPPLPVTHALTSTSASGGQAALPRITPTAVSSQASSPLSEAGSPDISECSRKSETITTAP